MNAQAIVYMMLIVNQVAATGTFIGLYRRSDWRSSPVGKHLMFFSIAFVAVDVAWLLLLLVQWPWLILVLFATQLALGALAWQRVRLVWQAQRAGPARD